jgi:hypothetical protein
LTSGGHWPLHIEFTYAFACGIIVLFQHDLVYHLCSLALIFVWLTWIRISCIIVRLRAHDALLVIHHLWRHHLALCHHVLIAVENYFLAIAVVEVNSCPGDLLLL